MLALSTQTLPWQHACERCLLGDGNGIIVQGNIVINVQFLCYIFLNDLKRNNIYNDDNNG